MTDDRIINKIIKLLALAEGKGATPGESAAAATQAQRLMLKYNIDAVQLDVNEQEDIEQQHFQEPTWRMRSWRSKLAWGVAMTNQCRALVAGGRYNGKNRKPTMAHVTFVGTPTNIAIVNYMYMYLAREIDRLAKEAKRPEHIQADRFRNAFRFGAVAEVVKRLSQGKAEVRKAPKNSAASSALVKLDDHARQVSDFVKNNIATRTVRVSHTSREGAAAGRKAGSKIALNDALNGKTRGLLS